MTSSIATTSPMMFCHPKASIDIEQKINLQEFLESFSPEIDYLSSPDPHEEKQVKTQEIDSCDIFSVTCNSEVNIKSSLLSEDEATGMDLDDVEHKYSSI